MPLPLQAMILRVLEGGVVRPVSASHERRVDVRVVAATHSNLQQEIAAGAFRSELYFRLAHAVLSLPSLRERREDISLLAMHFLETLGSEMGMHPPRLSPDALAAVERYDYPGNVRELKNLIERALIESGGEEVLPEHLHFAFPPIPSGSARGDPDRLPGGHAPGVESRSKRQEDEDRILAYVKTQGNINNTVCRTLLGVGMHRAWYLLRRLHRAGLLRQDQTGRWTRYRLP